jgi:hypothetical protein
MPRANNQTDVVLHKTRIAKATNSNFPRLCYTVSHKGGVVTTLRYRGGFEKLSTANEGERTEARKTTNCKITNH